MRAFFIGLLLGTFIGIFAMQNHVVRTGDGVVILPRANRPQLRSTIADVRDWSGAMWEQYPELKSAVVQAGRTDLFTKKGLGNYLNGNAPEENVAPKASRPAGDSEVALRYMQEQRSLPPIGAPRAAPPARGVPASQPDAESATVEEPATPFDAILGPATPFPRNASTGDQSPDPTERAFPFSPRRGSRWNQMPSQAEPRRPGAVPQQGVSRSVSPSAADPQNASGTNGEWVRGLLKSLIPSAESDSTNERADATGMDAPPPSTAGGSWKPISFQEPARPQPPLRVVRPF